MNESLAQIWPAPAKLNLFLHVTGRRSDGYHDIQTLFQLIDLHDEIQIESNKSGKISRTSGDYGVMEQEDLVVRAAKLLQTETGTRRGARIRVHKRIPVGAGLGGGSSNAATTLLVLNHLWHCNLSVEALAGLGTSLGADIPVFVKGETGLGSGIGEKLQALELGERHYVLVFNDYQISTADVFAHAALVRNSAPLSLSQVLSGEGKNDCEAVVKLLHPEFAVMLKELEEWGNPRMTGTGSCIFLAMPDKKAANSAASMMKCRYNVRAVCGIDRSPTHDMLDLTLGSFKRFQ